MSSKGSYQQFSAFLDVKCFATGAGAEVAVGEDFILNVKIQNTAILPLAPNIVFQNVRVAVIQTSYANHIGTNKKTVVKDMGGILKKGQSRTVGFSMLAKNAINNSTIPYLVPEKVAKVHVYADIDQNRFFQVGKTNIDAMVDIVRT